MKTENTEIPGLYRLVYDVHQDERGGFRKLFHAPQWAELGLRADFVEEYLSTSNKGVVRGLHFQVPPKQHAKVVTCLAGEAFDAVVDLRAGSPAFGKHVVFTLRPGDGLYLTDGLAHGFCALRDATTLLYRTTSVHSKPHDLGVRWDSAGITWPLEDPVLSARDKTFPKLEDFANPFVYAP